MNNSYVKPDKSKHVYVLGIDFGHGETSADICSIQWDTNFSQLTVPESIEIFNGVPAIKSILLIEKKWAGRKCLYRTASGFSLCKSEIPHE